MRNSISIILVLFSLSSIASELILEGTSYTYRISDQEVASKLFDESGYKMDTKSCEKGHMSEKRVLTNEFSRNMGSCFKICETERVMCELYIDQK